MATMPTPARGLATFVLSAQFLIDLLKQTGRVCYSIEGNALPEDAKIIGANYDAVNDQWIVGVESKHLTPIPINELAPRLYPATLVRHYKDEALIAALKDIQSLARANVHTMHDAFASIAIVAEEALELDAS